MNTKQTQIVHRFHSPTAARLIRNHAEKLTKHRLYVENIPHNDTRKDPPGNYAITYIENTPTLNSLNNVRKAVDMGIQLALADELKKKDPGNVLLSIWHLREENRNKIK